MNPCPSTEQLRALLADALTDPDAQGVEAHATSCPRCQEILEQLAGASSDQNQRHRATHEPATECHVQPGDDAAFFHKLQQAPPWNASPPQSAADGRLPELPGYAVLNKLGAGGMGVVYQARDLRLNRLVAVKMIHAGPHARPQDRLRFQIEAEAVAALQHPHIVQVYEVGEADGCPYLILEYVAGGSLAQRMRAQPLTFRAAAELVRTLALAVEHAHHHGILHRDLKPANVLLTADGQPKITDFGLAKRLGTEGGQTATGEVFGTPNYMAPEQAQGDKQQVGTATDVYALGAILYELLAGRPPFQADTPLATLQLVTHEEPPRPSQLGVKLPRDLETICLKCLAKEPPRRYATAAALADDLGRFLAGEPVQARPVSRGERVWRWCRRNPALAAVGLAALLTLGVAGFFAWRAAEAERQRAAEVRAEQRAAALNLALTMALNNEHDRAEQEIAAAEALGAAPGEVAKLRGIIAFYRERFQEAVTHLTRAEEALGQSVAVKSLLALAYGPRDPRGPSLAGEALLLQPQTPEDFLFHGQLLGSYGEPGEGLQEIEQAIGLKRSPVAMLVRARARSQLAFDTGAEEDAQKALRDAEVAREALPQSNQALAMLLWARLQLWDLYEDRQASGDPQRASEHKLAAGELVKAIASSRGSLPGAYGCVRYWMRTGQESTARKYLQAHRDVNPVPIRGLQATLLLRLGEPRSALEAVAAAPQIKALNPLLWVVVHAEVGKGKEAYHEVQDQTQAPIVSIFMGEIPLLLGEPAAARAHYQAMLDKGLVVPWRREWWDALVGYGASAGGPDEEKKLLDLAGASRKRQLNAHFLIGLRHLALGDRKQARRHFEQAINTGNFISQEYRWAEVFLARLAADPAWPHWILAGQ